MCVIYKQYDEHSVHHTLLTLSRKYGQILRKKSSEARKVEEKCRKKKKSQCSTAPFPDGTSSNKSKILD